MSKQIVEFTDPESGARARVSVGQGFNCFSWQPVLDDGPREMLWADAAFDSGEKRPSGSGIPLLFPFPGRIGGATVHVQWTRLPTRTWRRTTEMRFMDSSSTDRGESSSKQVRASLANFRHRSMTGRFSNAGRPIFSSAFRTKFVDENW